MLKISINAQGSRLIIMALQVGAVMETLRKRRDRVKTQFTTKTEVPPHPLNADVFYFLESPQVKITFLILLCIYIVFIGPPKIIHIYIYMYIILSDCLKLYK